eukprot:3392923-Pleurochrysis_carterae.AAC.2
MAVEGFYTARAAPCSKLSAGQPRPYRPIHCPPVSRLLSSPPSFSQLLFMPSRSSQAYTPGPRYHPPFPPPVPALATPP